MDTSGQRRRITGYWPSFANHWQRGELGSRSIHDHEHRIPSSPVKIWANGFGDWTLPLGFSALFPTCLEPNQAGFSDHGGQ
jgi:hypothetical protein